MIEGIKTFFSHIIHPIPFEYPIDKDGSQRVYWKPWMGEIYTKSGDGTWMFDQSLVDKHDPNYIYMFSIINHSVHSIVRYPKDDIV
jgi:hypothetical protein